MHVLLIEISTVNQINYIKSLIFPPVKLSFKKLKTLRYLEVEIKLKMLMEDFKKHFS
jgi:hypothetical protein